MVTKLTIAEAGKGPDDDNDDNVTPAMTIFLKFSYVP